MINISSKTQEKDAPLGNILEIFLLDTLKITFWVGNLIQSWIQSVPFLPKSGHCFRFSKKSKGGNFSSPPSSTPVSVAEYASTSLNIPKYPWKCLSKTFRLYQGPQYTWSSYMFDKLLKMPQVLNKPGFWIWHSHMAQGLRRVRNMSDYGSIRLNNAWIFFNIP